MRPTEKLHSEGQSLWLDNITRKMLDSGQLARYVEQYSVTGLTSNPSIFDKAIESGDYDAEIREKVSHGVTVSADHYRAAPEAYLRGIERRIGAGLSPRVGSVASVFVSRWDKAANPLEPPRLHNRLALAIELRIESWRWAGVPFFVRAGKCLPVDAIEVRIQLKGPPRDIYREHAPSTQHFRFRIGPDVTALALGMRIKQPGEQMVGRDIELLASECQARDMLPYERLLGDALRGDASLFARQDTIEAQWRIVDPVLDIEAPPHPYDVGCWGPADADRLVGAVPGGWRTPVDPRRT